MGPKDDRLAATSRGYRTQTRSAEDHRIATMSGTVAVSGALTCQDMGCAASPWPPRQHNRAGCQRQRHASQHAAPAGHRYTKFAAIPHSHVPCSTAFQPVPRLSAAFNPYEARPHTLAPARPGPSSSRRTLRHRAAPKSARSVAQPRCDGTTPTQTPTRLWIIQAGPRVESEKSCRRTTAATNCSRPITVADVQRPSNHDQPNPQGKSDQTPGATVRSTLRIAGQHWLLAT